VVTANPVRIAITGTHSTGKSTLLRRLEMELRAVGHAVARTTSSLAQKAADMGFPKMHQQTANTTRWIMSAGICAEMEATLTADVVLVDRSTIDPLAYYLATLEHLEQPMHSEQVGELTTIATAHAAGYDLLLATQLDPAVPLGPHRDRDPDYRARVDHHIHTILGQHAIPHTLVANTDTSRDAAIQAALQATVALAGAA